MKIGVLTFHYAHNCGACLQAFALKEFLSNKGQDVRIINYKNPKISSLYPKRLTVKFLPYDFKNPKQLGKKIRLLKDYRFGRKEWESQYQKFESFIDQYLLSGDKAELTACDVKSLQLDLFIAGSDQIWNKYLTAGYDGVYFLDFQTSAHKAFYAASSGVDALCEEDLPFFESALAQTNKYVSVREQAFAAFLASRFHRPVPSVVDPCFLLSENDYIDLFSLDKPQGQTKKHYLFAYFISEKNKAIREMVYMIANALGLEIVEFHYRKSRDLYHKYQTSDMGPEEFLHLIYNASFVVTNSFHGTVFSILFKKQFYSVYDKDARKDNLLERLELSKRHIKDFDEIDLNLTIDYDSIHLEDYSRESKLFLEMLIKEYDK